MSTAEECKIGANKNKDEKTNKTDGLVTLQNPNLKSLKTDVLYHLTLDTNTHDLVKMFGDVKIVCMGGAPGRMENFAHYIKSELRNELPPGTEVQFLEKHSYRYAMYKIGPILSISHGIGICSLQILLHEIIKLLYYARVKNPVFFRIGTSGGVGVPPGSIVITNEAVDEMLQPHFQHIVLGKIVQKPSKFNLDLINELKALHEPSDDFNVVVGKTMCSTDFYEGQGRTDGAFCSHTEEDKMRYLNQLYEAGVRNIEMEATCFGALTHLAGIRAAILCVTFLDRLKGDQVDTPKSILQQWELRPQKFLSRYIKRHL